MRQLIFVYNADAGPLHTALDIAHKLFSPATYRCDLCKLTHGLLRERETWQQFRASSGDELRFFHRDEFEREYPERYRYPVVLEEGAAGRRVVLDAAALAALDLEGLIERLR